MKWLSALLAGVGICIANIASAEVAPWALAFHDTDQDIKIFTRVVAGSPVKEFKGITHVKTTASAFVALQRDVDVATQWLNDLRRLEVVDSPADNENVIYTIHDAPWPVSDRDSYVRSVMSADSAGVVTLTMTAEPDFAKKNKGYVRISSLQGSWVISPQPDGMIEVVYQVHSNPGGSLPTWATNSIVVDTPLKTLRNFRKIVLKEKYQGKTFKFIDAAKASASKGVVVQ